MVTILNRLDQPFLIHLGKAGPLHLLARASAVLEDDEASTTQVQTLIAAGVLECRPFATDRAELAAAPPRERKLSHEGARRREEPGLISETAAKKTEV